jgi:hypothetical protein
MKTYASNKTVLQCRSTVLNEGFEVMYSAKIKGQIL